MGCPSMWLSIVLVYLGTITKCINRVAYEQQTCISHSSRGWKSKIKFLSRLILAKFLFLAYRELLLSLDIEREGETEGGRESAISSSSHMDPSYQIRASAL